MNIRKMLILSLLLNLLLLSLFVVFSYRYNLPNRVAIRLGLKEKPRTQDYLTVISWNKTMESIKYDADVVFFGASITSDAKWHEYFDSLKICNLGKSGDNLESMLLRVPQISAVHPKKIFFAPEQNDMHLLSIKDFKEKLVILLDSIQRSNPQSEIYLESLLPLNEKKYNTVCNNEKILKANAVIKCVAIEKGFTYINLYDEYIEDGQLPMSMSYDGQHLKPNAYLKWYLKINSFVIKL